MYNLDQIYKDEAEDVSRVREAIKDYYGTAMMNGFPMAGFDLAKVDSMTDDEILLHARKIGII